MHRSGAISFSGTTFEILGDVPSIKRIGAKLIAMTGNLESPLAKAADAVLPVAIRREACSMNMAPTSSTIATLALGDALALILSEMAGFRPEQFAIYHPGGALGRRLLLKVKDVMRTQVITCQLTTPIDKVAKTLIQHRIHRIIVVDSDRPVGIITSLDLVRLLVGE